MAFFILVIAFPASPVLCAIAMGVMTGALAEMLLDIVYPD